MSKLKKNLDEALQKSAGKLGESMKAVKPKAAARQTYRDEPVESIPGPARKGPRNTAVSFTREEYEFLKEVFETKARGMKVSTGIKMAALYVAERLDIGSISMSRAGIVERR